jgi:hypothetical protein
MRTLTLEKPSEDSRFKRSHIASQGNSSFDVWPEDTASLRSAAELLPLPGWRNHSPTEGVLADALKIHSPTQCNVVKGYFVSSAMRLFARLLDDLTRIASRLPNWDGDDGVAPSPEAMHEAIAFLDFLKDTGGLPQCVYSPGDGEINFEWRAARRFTEVGFNGDKTVSWFHRDAQGELFGDEAFDPSNIWENRDLLQVLGIADVHFK